MHSALFYIVVVLGSLAILTTVAIASTASLGVHDPGCRVHGVRSRVSLDSSALPGGAEARSGLSPDHTFHSVGVPAAPDHARASSLDLIFQRTAAWRPIVRALAAGAAFLGVFIAVQWPFADFLMSPLARNWVFGTEYMDFGTPARSLYARFVFSPREASLRVLARDAHRDDDLLPDGLARDSRRPRDAEVRR